MRHNQYALLCNSPTKVEKMTKKEKHDDTMNMHFCCNSPAKVEKMIKEKT